MPDKNKWAIVDKEAQEEAAQDYLRLISDAEDETTLSGAKTAT